jgi:uncharacterized protein YjbJ (UPF0337 family)
MIDISLSDFCRSPAASIAPKRSKTMNWDQMKGNWKQFKGKMKQQWGKLTDDDLDRVEGKREELAGKLQERYVYAKEKAEKEIDEFCNRC